MDQGNEQSQLPLHPEYDESDPHDSFDDFAPHSHPSSAYPNPIEFRREGALPGEITHVFPFTSANTPRFAVPTAGIPPDTSSFRHAHGLGEPSSSTLLPHISSSEATHPYTFPHLHNYTHLPALNSALYPQGNPHAVPRPSSVLDVLSHGMPGRLGSSHTPLLPRDTHYFTSLPPQRPPPPGSAFGPETPQAHHYGGLPPTDPTYPAIPPHERPPQPPPPRVGSPSRPHNESAAFQFLDQHTVCPLEFVNGEKIGVVFKARVEKGFFPDPVTGEWTCYRRNYFSVNGSFCLDPFPGGGQAIYCVVDPVKHERKLVKAFGLRISATVEEKGPDGKVIELVQHTPKRDNGPKTKVGIVKVAPSADTEEHVAAYSTHQLGSYHHIAPQPGPYLPYQGEPDPLPAAASNNQHAATSPVPSGGNSAPSGLHQRHLFDRIQFKVATANNGKRRASQQYFQLILELHADIREEGETEPNWVKVACRFSQRLVVRGRSPNHYQSERNNAGGRAAASNRSTPFPLNVGQPSMNGPSTYGNLQSNGARALAHSGYGESMPGPSQTYRSQYGYNASEAGPSSSPTDIPVSALPPPGPSLEGHPHGFVDARGYSYFPSTIYEVGQGMEHGQRHGQLPIPKVEQTYRRSTTDPSQYQVRPDYQNTVPGAAWDPHQINTNLGPTTSSTGYFPTFQHPPHVGTDAHLNGVAQQPPTNEEADFP